MKKLLLGAIFGAMTCTYSACNTDSPSGLHQTGFLGIDPSGVVLFADQTIDTLLVASTDNWTLTLNPANTWLKATPESQEVKPGYQLVTPLALSIQTNTTQENRTARLQLHNAFLTESNIAISITQLPYHNVVRPLALRSSSAGLSKEVIFAESLSATLYSTYAVFTLYNPGDTLVSHADWLRVDSLAAKPKKGKNTILLVARPNPDKQVRTATVSLRASGVETKFVYTQAAKRD